MSTRRDSHSGKMNITMKKKLAGLFIFVVLALICLLIRITFINLVKGGKYTRQVLASSQAQYSSTAMAYKRGDILDRNGAVLATSEKRYNVILDCYVVNSDEKYIDPTVHALGEYMQLDEGQIRVLLADEKTRNSRYQIIKRGITVEEKQAFDKYKSASSDTSLSESARAERSNTRGIWFEEEYIRTYPMGSLAGEVLGFVYDTDKADWGLEGYYNNTLCGVDGRKYGYFGSDSELEQTIVDPVDGNTVRTTLDVNIQGIVENVITRFEDAFRNGPYSQTEAAANVGVVVMDPSSGGIYAMASSRGYDPNNPRDLSAYYSETQISRMSDEQKVNYLNQIWKNFCISDSYEPGSVFKPVTVSSALESGAIREDAKFLCDGYETVSGVNIKCAKNEGHGEESLSDVVANSCNDGLMQIGSSLGIDNFSKYQQMFGFGSRTGVDLSGEATGIIGHADTMGSVDLATASFGQGFTCTMVQEASAIAAVINGGYYYRPHFVTSVLASDGSVKRTYSNLLMKQCLSGDVSALLRDYMKQSVDKGTSQFAKVDGYSMGGKTGTAQKIPRGNGKYLVSWIGFAPADNPRVLIYTVVDEPNVADQADNRYAQWISRDILSQVLPYLGVYPDEPGNPNNPYLQMDLENVPGEEKEEETDETEENARDEWYYDEEGDLRNGNGHMIDEEGYLINDDREYVDDNDNVVDESEKTTGYVPKKKSTSANSDMAADTNVPEPQGTEDEDNTSGGNRQEADGYTNEEAGLTEDE